MQLQEYKKLDVELSGDGYNIAIKAERLESEFTDTDRNVVLYSHIDFHTDDFNWSASLPTVRIPYRDPSLGFMLGGVVFSSVGNYRRAPGVILGKNTKVNSGRLAVSNDGGTDCIDIITSRNSTLSIVQKGNGIQIAFSKGDTTRYVPVGPFLKAYSGMPYSVLLGRLAYKPQILINSFISTIPDRITDLTSIPVYSSSNSVEPTIEDCVDRVYSSVIQRDSRSASTTYSAQWKSERIRNYFEGLHFKNEQNYESNLSLHSRAHGTRLDQDLKLPIYAEDGTETTYTLRRGTFIDESITSDLRWYDVPTLRVKTTRSFLLQEDTPMLFRAQGYKLARDIPELGLEEGVVITRDILKRINTSDIRMLEVYTPVERKVLYRSGEHPEIGDFITILNCLLTGSFREHDQASQYEVANRVVFDYDKEVELEVEQTYQEIIDALAECTELKHIVSTLPKLPSARLGSRLRDVKNKELGQAEITNIMSRAISERRASAFMKSTPAAMTAVQRGQYARIDSLHSPESDKVGSVQELTYMSKLNRVTGEIEAPYEIVRNGVPTGEIEYISAAKEANKYIADWDNQLTDPVVTVRYNDNVTTVDSKRVHYRDVSPFCDMSVSRMTIPFPEFSQPRRSLMATKMSGQAIPLVFPERPLVSTGADTMIPCLYYTARQIVESSLGADAVVSGTPLELVNVRWGKTSASYTCIYGERSFTYSVPFLPTDKNSLYSYNLNYREGYRYNLNDIVFYNQSCDIKEHDYFVKEAQGTMPLVDDISKPAMALGVNLVVGFKTYSSCTIDDAVVISDRLIKNRKLSSIQIMKYEYELKAGEKFHPTRGVAEVHTYVYEFEPVITVLRDKASRTVEKHVKANMTGEVIMSELNAITGVASVWVATFHDADIGDKVAGRYGNKSVIAKIVPEYEMPYDPETGQSLDILCSPLGIPSRMNYGQVLEITLGAAMREEGKHAFVTPFYPGIKDIIRDKYNNAGLVAKPLYHPMYGKFTERPVMVGVMYFLKLEQISNLKYAAVGYPTSVDSVFGQPVASLNSDKGQAIGEMETWALAAAGANQTLNNLFTFYAPDEYSRKRYFELLQSNRDTGNGTWDECGTDVLKYRVDNKDAIVTQTVHRMFGLELQSKTERDFEVLPLKMSDIRIEASALDLKNHSELTTENEWCKVKLQAPVVNPFWIRNFPLHIILGVPSVRALVNGDKALNVYTREILAVNEISEANKAAYITGIDAVIALLRETTIGDAIDRLTVNNPSEGTRDDDTVSEEGSVVEKIEVEVVDAEKTKGANTDETADPFSEDPEINFDRALQCSDVGVRRIVKLLQRMKEHGMELSDLIWEYMPIMPKVFRQTSIVAGREHEHSFQKQLRHICSCSRSSDIYNALVQLIGYGKSRGDDLISIRGYFFGKDSEAGKHGTVRGNVLSKRVGFSGRSVITPMADPSISPFFVGIPWRIAMVELSSVLAIRLRNRASKMSFDLVREFDNFRGVLENLELKQWEEIICSLGEFNPYIFRKYFTNLDQNDLLYLYNYLREVVREICEGDTREDGYVKYKGKYVPPEEVPDGATIDACMVLFGRQPTLHKKSLRVFLMKLVDGFCSRIHPLVCAAYNADFDGDTMWNCQLFGNAKNEASRTVSVVQDLISEKDGSYTLSISQDTALGLYCATIFKNNSLKPLSSLGEFHYFTNADELRFQLEYGTLHYYDVVVFEHDRRKYLSTAGRILVNSCIPGAFTSIPFTDKWGICEAVFGHSDTSGLYQMKYDAPWVVTGIRPEGRKDAVKIEDILLEVYSLHGARASIMLAQRLYEIGVVACDIYSVSASAGTNAIDIDGNPCVMDDMSVGVNVDEFMEGPKTYVAKLNSLEQMGLISVRERKQSAIQAWDSARKNATASIVAAIPENSNTHFMMYSGARGKPDQVMQTVGFIGTISKTSDSDIEYPILRSYGRGLKAMDLAQTRYMARIGVVSTQAGTKQTGYATRQSVYMLSGMTIKEEDCGIGNSTIPVIYSADEMLVTYNDGTVAGVDSLIGEFVDPSSDGFDLLAAELNRSGYMINESVLDIILKNRLTSLTLIGKTVTLQQKLDRSWKQRMIDEGYSYCIPYAVDGKLTEASLNWIEENGLTEAVIYDKDHHETNNCFHAEAYLPVDYDWSKYTLYLDDKKVEEEVLLGRKVTDDTEGLKYYVKLLDSSGCLNSKAMQYLTKKGVRAIKLDDGRNVTIKYAVHDLFKGTVLGRCSCSLPCLDRDNAITEDTLAEIERYQLRAIPVRTAMTCLAEGGVCAVCHGKSLSTKQYLKAGTNIGIPASQAACEPLSQATLNVTHSGGKRGAGVGLVSGLDYYKKMLKGSLITKSNEHLREKFAPFSGYIEVNQYDPHFFQLVSDDGSRVEPYQVSDVDLINVPDGAYVNEGDTVVAGIPCLDRFLGSDIFASALAARYLLMQEYYKIFKGLKVSPRNYEILARAQISICYLNAPVNLPETRDTSVEIKQPTGKYVLRVASQSEVVNKYSGVSGFAFEDVAYMMASAVCNSEGIAMNSVLGNLVTGTVVGSKQAKFIPPTHGASNSRYTKSAVKTQAEEAKSFVSGVYVMHLGDGDRPTQSLAGVNAAADSLLQDLLNINAALGGDTSSDVTASLPAPDPACEDVVVIDTEPNVISEVPTPKPKLSMDTKRANRMVLD